jgi:hypothetical protein
VRRWDGHFRLAHGLRKSLNELLGIDLPLTHRQYILWLHWLKEEWNHPSRDNFYLMAVAQKVVQVQVKHPDLVKLKDFEITFEDIKPPAEAEEDLNRDHGTIGGVPVKPPRRVTKRDIENLSKAVWQWRVTGQGRPPGLPGRLMPAPRVFPRVISEEEAEKL